MTDKDNITLPREVVQEALEALEFAERHNGGDDCYADSITALRSVLAAEQPKPSGYAYRYADNVLRFNDGGWLNGWPPVEAVPYWFAPPALAAEPTKPSDSLKAMKEAFRILTKPESSDLRWQVSDACDILRTAIRTAPPAFAAEQPKQEPVAYFVDCRLVASAGDSDLD